GAQIALAQVRQHDDDKLAGVLGTAGDLDGDMGGGAGADAAQDALFAGHAPSHDEGVVILNLDDLVHDAEVEHIGHEAGADTLDLVPAGLQGLALHLLRDHRAGHRLDGDALEARLALLDDLADAGNGAARADAGHEDVTLAVGVAPDFLGGGLAVDLRV